MDEKIQESILARLQRLEDDATRVRPGIITNRSPLTVDIGGTAVPGVRSIGVPIDGNDRVHCLLAGKDVMVLGRANNGATMGVRHVEGNGTPWSDPQTQVHDLDVEAVNVQLTTNHANLHAALYEPPGNEVGQFTFAVRHVGDANWGDGTGVIEEGVLVYWVAWS